MCHGGWEATFACCSYMCGNVVHLNFKCHRSWSERWIPLIKFFRFVDYIKAIIVVMNSNRKWGWTPMSYFSHSIEFLSSTLVHNSTVCECLCLCEAQGQRRSTSRIMITLFWWIVVWSHVRWKVLQWSEHLWSMWEQSLYELQIEKFFTHYNNVSCMLSYYKQYIYLFIFCTLYMFYLLYAVWL